MSNESGLDPAQMQQMAAYLYNHTWDLLDLGTSRTDAQTLEMIDAAHASNWHWSQIGGVEQAVVGTWMISRVNASAGYGPEAVRYAQQSLALLESGSGLPDWLGASVQEGLARAYLAADDRATAMQHATLAQEALTAIAEADDKALIAEHLAELGLDAS